MLSSGELLAWWNLSHRLGGHCCTLLGALHGVRCSSQVCMYVHVSHNALCLLACLHSPQLVLLVAAASLLFFFCFVLYFFFCFFWFLDLNPKRKFLNSYHMVMTIPGERKKKIPGKKKTVWQALETASSKTHLQCSVDYYAQQWTGS
jgi:hypothetical protein